jgi:D-alanyl-D-alanine carboxypeptidase (penicillin-binding protein 5/6)
LNDLMMFASHVSLTTRLKRQCLGLLAAAALLAHGPLRAQAPGTALPQPPEIAAKSYLLLDMTSGQVLASKDADTPTEPASLTKLMTAYLVFSALRDKKLDLNQELVVSERAWRTGMSGASRMYIDLNSKVRVEDLIKGMIIQSGNDATVALAEGVAGSVERFVELMNQQAAAFGLKSTSFKNPEGLTAAGHLSTARELGVIAQRLISDFPQFLPYYSTREFTWNKIKQSNRNLLLYRDPTVDGLKTGYTDAAGYCLISTAKRDFPNLGQRRLISVVLGAASMDARAAESQKLLNWGFTAWDAIKLFEANQAVTTPEVWKGKANQVKLGRTTPIVVAVPSGQAGKLSTAVQRAQPLVAPIQQGERVATLQVRLGNDPKTAPFAEVPLNALESVPTAGVLGRAWDSLRLLLK